jgi:hypothetical protein
MGNHCVEIESAIVEKKVVPVVGSLKEERAVEN